MDPTPALTARIDQQEMEAREMAKVIATYRKSLIDQGMPEEQANELTHAYAETYWDNALHRCCPCPPEEFD